MDRKSMNLTSLPLHLQHDTRREWQTIQSSGDDSISFNVFDLVPPQESKLKKERVEMSDDFRKLGSKQSSFRDIIDDSRGFADLGLSSMDGIDPIGDRSSSFYDSADFENSFNEKDLFHKGPKEPLSSESSLRDMSCQGDAFAFFPGDADFRQNSSTSFDSSKVERRTSTRVKKNHVSCGDSSDEVTVFPRESFERATLFRAFSTKSFNPFTTIDEEANNSIQSLNKDVYTCEDSISELLLQNSTSGHASQSDSFDKIEELNHSNGSLTRKPPRPRPLISSKGKSRSTCRKKSKEFDPPPSPHSSTANSTSQYSSSMEETADSSCPPSPMFPNVGRRLVHSSPGRRRRHVPHSPAAVKTSTNKMKMPDKLLNEHLTRRVMRESLDVNTTRNEDPKAEAAAQAALLLESFLKSKLRAIAAEKERKDPIDTQLNCREYVDFITHVTLDDNVQMISVDECVDGTHQVTFKPENVVPSQENRIAPSQLQSKRLSTKSERQNYVHESMKEAGKILSLHLAQRKPMPFSRHEASSIMPQVGMSRTNSEIPESPMGSSRVSAQSPRRAPRAHASASRSRLRQLQGSNSMESPISPSKRSGSTLRPRRKYSDSTLQVSPKRSSRAISRGPTRPREIPDIFH